MLKKILCVLPILVIVLLFASCEPTELHQPAAVAFVIGNTMGNESPVSYIPSLPAEIMNRAAAEHSVYAIVSVSKNPEITHRTTIPEYTGTTKAQRKQDHAFFLNQLRTDIREKSVPGDEGSDLLKAIAIAVAYLENTAKDRDKILVIIDNFILVDGEFKFDNNNIHALFSGDRGLIDSRMDIAVSHLVDNNIVVDLSGITIVTAGIGNTSSPQEPLSSNQRTLLRTFWNKIFNAANAEAIIHVSGQTGISSNSTLPVTVINFPKEEPIYFGTPPPLTEPPPTLTIDFEIDSDILINPEKDEVLIHSYAEKFIEYLENNNSTGKLYVVGANSKGRIEPSYDTSLSMKRSIAVRNLLIQFNVPADVLECVAVGEWSPWRTFEFDSNGVLIDEIAKTNRTIMLIPDYYTEHVEAVLTVREELNSMN